MDDETNDAEPQALSTPELVPGAAAVRRKGPAWEGRHIRSRAADRTIPGCRARTLGASTSSPDDLLPSVEGRDRKLSVAAAMVKNTSTFNAKVLNAAKPDEMKSSDCMEVEESRRRLQAPSQLDGGDVATIERNLHATPVDSSSTWPANQYHFDTKSELSIESCIAGVADTTATGQPQREEAERATHRVFESKIDLDRVSSTDNQTPAAERNRERTHRSKGDFEELLAEAMRQSDAERAQDRQDANIFVMLQSSSLQEQQQNILHHSTSAHTQPAGSTTASDRTSDCDIERELSYTKHDTDQVAIATTDYQTSSALSAPIAHPEAIRRQWIEYISPEGYPYLHDEVTGESKWVVSGEQEDGERDQRFQAQEPAYGEESREPRSTQCTIRSRDGQVDPHGTANVKVEGKQETTYAAERSSVSTCDVSQWSQETSGPDARNSAGETAMHLAATQHCLRGLSVLLASGANINAIDHRGRTPLHALCVSSHGNSSGGESETALPECMDLLLSSGAMEDARDREGQSALHLAAQVGNLCAAKALIAAGAKVAADDTGNSPLHVAAAQGHSDIIHLLVTETGHESTWKPQVSSDNDTRDQSRIPADVGRLSPASDGGLLADREETGHIPDGRRKCRIPDNNGGVFGGVARAKEHQQSAAEETSCKRESFSRRNSRRIPRMTGETSRSKADRRFLSEHVSLESTPPSFDGHLHRGGIHHEQIEAGWQEQIDIRGQISENSTRETNETDTEHSSTGDEFGRFAPDHEDRRRVEGKEGRRHISRHLRRRHGNGRGDEMLPWPKALPACEYQQIMGAVFAGEEDRSDTPSRSTVSAALFAACLGSRFNDAAAVLRLLELHGGDVAEVRDDNGRTPLHHVCRTDDVSLLRLLCRAGSDLEARDCQGNSPLTVAAATGSLACLQVLIRGGSYLGGFNGVGDTPLHLAVRHGNLACVKALVEGGARLSQRNKQSFTPREDLLKAAPFFAKGRLPKVLRATFEYIECAEASAAQPNSPSWTAQDGQAAIFSLGPSSPRKPLGNGGRRYHTGLEGNPRMDGDSPRCADRERREYEPGEGRDPLEGRSEACLDGSVRGKLSRGGSDVGYDVRRVSPQDVARVERCSNSSWEGETRRKGGEESPEALAGDPSRVPKGLWSVVGRAIDSFIGGGNVGHQGRSPSAADGRDDSDDNNLVADCNGRPPTDAELRATAGPEEGSAPVNGPDVSHVAPHFQLPPSDEQVNMPISLTPMQPPPDVLAAMKGRAAVGKRRPRFTSPPADVAEALGKIRESKRYGRSEHYGGISGADDPGSGSGRRYLGRSAENM